MIDPRFPMSGIDVPEGAIRYIDLVDEEGRHISAPFPEDVPVPSKGDIIITGYDREKYEVLFREFKASSSVSDESVKIHVKKLEE